MSKAQKKFVQQDFPSQPLLSEKEIRRGFAYTDIGAVEVTGTILGRAKIRKVHPRDQMKLRWLTLIIFLLILAAAIGLTTHIEQKVDSLSTPTIETVIVPLSQSAVKPAPDAATGSQSTAPAVTGSMQTNLTKINTTQINPVAINPEKINQVKTKQIEPDVATKTGEAEISQINTGEVKKPPVLEPPIILPPNVEVPAPSTEIFQDKESIAPVEHLVDEPAPVPIAQPDSDSNESLSE